MDTPAARTSPPPHLLKHPTITRGRLARFAREIKAALYPRWAPLAELSVYAAPGRIGYAAAVEGDYREARAGMQFGPGWSTHWFRIAYRIPKEWRGGEVLLHFDSTSEGCVWRDGVPRQGLTNFNLGPQDIRSHYRLAYPAQGGETGRLYVEAAINGLFGLDRLNGAIDPEPLGTLRHARLVERDRAVWDLLWDFVTVKEMAECLPPGGPHQGPALTAANAIVNAVSVGEPETYAAGREIARRFLAARNGDRNHRVFAVGHAHLDSAWLWPVAETKRKCYRTFSTAVQMMEDYPEYKFACAQAQQLAWIQEEHPALYARIQERAAAGQFLPVGGTWIEPDCNLPSGESLVRQFLLGQRFFRREFGAYCREFWNPDVFGYSGALPQIMREAGIEFFLTQKLSWNQFNPPTSSTFQWEGIDGSRVLTHFPPADTYHASATVEELLLHHQNFKDKERASESVMLFGYGDGGGGPTEEMLERLRRLGNVAGLPEVSIARPQDFFARCATDLPDPIVWSGELYFEMHRGTYTTQAATKRDNRRGEELLHDVEFLLAVSGADAARKGEVQRLWETLCFNQFHDIIPGSSIGEVYVDSARDYAEIFAAGKRLRAGGEAAILPPGEGGNILALNTLSWDRREVATLGGKLTLAEAPAYGYAVAAPRRETLAPVRASETPAGYVLENGLVRATLDRDGRLTSFLDKRQPGGGREVIAAPGCGNQFALYEDKPMKWDAWDVEVYHLEKRRTDFTALASAIVARDPLRATVEFKLRISARASLTQRITLDAESPRLDFDVEVDWRENEQFLKVEFPLALRSDHATYEIQFGHVRRPTHFNTSWDVARFEVSAHRWADLSEPNYGVALLNDCKYGYACHGNVLRLSLLRAPKAPDPQADMGLHRFRYALFPHAGGPQTGGVIPAAAGFNQPLRLFASGAEAQARSFFSLDNPAVVLDTVKPAEDSSDLIVRLYESHGGHQNVTLTVGLPLKEVRRVNLLEEGEDDVPFHEGRVELSLRPFELVTLKLSGGKGV